MPDGCGVRAPVAEPIVEFLTRSSATEAQRTQELDALVAAPPGLPAQPHPVVHELVLAASGGVVEIPTLRMQLEIALQAGRTVKMPRLGQYLRRFPACFHIHEEEPQPGYDTRRVVGVSAVISAVIGAADGHNLSAGGGGAASSAWKQLLLGDSPREGIADERTPDEVA